MAKFCGKCGNALEEGAKFCAECGNMVQEQKVETQKVPEIKNPEPVSAPQPQPQAVSPKPTAPIQPRPTTAQAQPRPVTPQPSIAHQTSAPVTVDKTSKVAGMGAFFGLMLLFALPVIGFIAAIVFSFAPKNKNIKNFARATLVWMIIGIVIAGIIIGIFYAMAASILNVVESTINEYNYEYGAKSTVNYDDIYDAVSEAEDIIENFDYSVAEKYVTAVQ